MRLHPSVPNIRRYINEEISMGGYKIPAGVTIGIAIYALHRNPEIYPEPDAFKPERFRPEQSAEMGKVHSYFQVPI